MESVPAERNWNPAEANIRKPACGEEVDDEIALITGHIAGRYFRPGSRRDMAGNLDTGSEPGDPDGLQNHTGRGRVPRLVLQPRGWTAIQPRRRLASREHHQNPHPRYGRSVRRKARGGREIHH